MKDTPLDVAAISDETVEEVLRLGEEFLAGTIQLAVAADQRGTTMAGILGAASVALLAGAGAIAGTEHLSPLFWSFVATSSLLFVSAFLCAWSARSTNFYIGGYEPRLITQSTGANLTWIRRYAAGDIQARIHKNRVALESAGRGYNFGVVLGGLAPFVGLAAYVCFS